MIRPAIKALHSVLRIIATGAPWVISMYILYWLEYGQIWSPDTPHRGKMSVIILVIGMSLSLLNFSRVFKSSRRP